MIDQFTTLVAQSSFLTAMINAPQELSHELVADHGKACIRYLWDGYMDCWILLDADGRYWDLQDQIELPPREEYVREYRSFDSLEALIANMERTLS